MPPQEVPGTTEDTSHVDVIPDAAEAQAKATQRKIAAFDMYKELLWTLRAATQTF